MFAFSSFGLIGRAFALALIVAPLLSLGGCMSFGRTSADFVAESVTKRVEAREAEREAVNVAAAATGLGPVAGRAAVCAAMAQKGLSCDTQVVAPPMVYAPAPTYAPAPYAAPLPSGAPMVVAPAAANPWASQGLGYAPAPGSVY